MAWRSRPGGPARRRDRALESAYLRAVRSIPPLTPLEELDLARRLEWAQIGRRLEVWASSWSTRDLLQLLLARGEGPAVLPGGVRGERRLDRQRHHLRRQRQRWRDLTARRVARRVPDGDVEGAIHELQDDLYDQEDLLPAPREAVDELARRLLRWLARARAMPSGVPGREVAAGALDELEQLEAESRSTRDALLAEGPALEHAEALVEAARNELAAGNLRLVVHEARRYASSGFSLLDLVQEGNLGLLRAVERFDHRRGYRLATYARWWVRQGILRSMDEERGTIRVPPRASGRRARLQRASQGLALRSGRAPTDEALARRLELPVEVVRELQRMPRVTASLDEPVDGEGEESVGDRLSDDEGSDPSAEAEARDLRRLTRAALDTLTPRERSIVEMCYGLGRPRRSLAEIGRDVGLSSERVRQILGEAMDRLRRQEELAELSESTGG